MLQNGFKNRSRLDKEYNQLCKNLHPDIYKFVEQEQDGNNILMALYGPKNTIYENNTYHIQIQITASYPFEPPKITCLTPIIHPNIYKGEICVDVFRERWTPAHQIHTIMIVIHHLLTSPDISIPNDSIELSLEHAAYKKQSMRHFQVWGGRRGLVLYLVGCGLLKRDSNNDRYPDLVEKNKDENNYATIKVMSRQCFLHNIFEYL
jgi:ubiquitin-protein ligase